MSISANFMGGLVKASPHVLSTADKEDVFTATGRDEIIATVSIVNENTSTATVTLYRYDGASDFAILHKIIAARDTEIVTEIPLRLYDGEKLKAKSSQSSNITITPIIVSSGNNESVHRPNA